MPAFTVQLETVIQGDEDEGIDGVGHSILRQHLQRQGFVDEPFRSGKRFVRENPRKVEVFYEDFLPFPSEYDRKKAAFLMYEPRNASVIRPLLEVESYYPSRSGVRMAAVLATSAVGVLAYFGSKNTLPEYSFFENIVVGLACGFLTLIPVGVITMFVDGSEYKERRTANEKLLRRYADIRNGAEAVRAVLGETNY